MKTEKLKKNEIKKAGAKKNALTQTWFYGLHQRSARVGKNKQTRFQP
jgi:hypothetical protein